MESSTESSTGSRSLRRYALILSVLALTVVVGACQKKVAAVPPAPTPPAPAPASPTVTLTASPNFITQGQQSTLHWTSQNATKLDLEPTVGSVQTPSGSTTVSPDTSTTYTITATGPGGNAVDTVRVTVSPKPAPQPSAPSATLEQLFAEHVKDAFFNFNMANIRPDARAALTQDAAFLRAHPNVDVTIEGHCDERGSLEYNLALGQRRASAAKNFLVSLGISASRMSTMSYGKEHPFCTQHNEACWQQNRRAHFVLNP